MKKLFSGFLFVAAVVGLRTLYAQQGPSIEWQKCLGGTRTDLAYSIQQISDGGFIVAGTSGSNDGDISGNHGISDYWVVKLDADGNLVWQRSLGGYQNDKALSIHQTNDGGFIVAGTSNSNDGDVSENNGGYDSWIVKLDGDGNLVWQKSFGGSNNEEAHSIQQTNDDGFIVAGYSSSNDGDVSENHGLSDYWIVKLDAVGNLLWQKTFGGSDFDQAQSVQQTTDGGFIVIGESWSLDGDITGNHGMADYWIIKLDSMGNLIWQKSFGGSADDFAWSVQQITDNGFIVAGLTNSNDGDVSGNHGWADFWILKLDTVGNLIWQKTFGGNSLDEAFSIQQTTDDGFIVAGTSASNDGDVSGNHGGDDYWIVKLNMNGNLVWQKSLGGSIYEMALSIQQTTDGGFIVAGHSASNDGDVTGWHEGYDNYSFFPDYWIVKLSVDTATGTGSPLTNFISLHPNPIQNLLTVDLATQADATIRVYDLQGRIILLPTTFTNSQAQLNTSDLPNGFYTIQINTKTGASRVGKFVKQQ